MLKDIQEDNVVKVFGPITACPQSTRTPHCNQAAPMIGKIFTM